MKILEIADILAQNIPDSPLGNMDIEYLLTDSRRLAFPEKTCFFAVKTEFNDGHKYIPELIEKGVKCFVVNECKDEACLRNEELIFFYVDNVVEALQKIAAAHRNKFNIPIIAITGSNGKTIVKEWLTQILSTKFKVVSNYGSYNSQIGVPLSVWNLKNDTQIGIFEAGISQRGEMNNLQKVIRPTIGIFTNIGTAHSKNFNNQEEKVSEKMKLFRDVELLFSYKNNCAFADFNLPFVDAASIENIQYCIAVAKYFGIEDGEIQRVINELSPIDMRLELKKGINNCTIINDSCSFDFTSLQVAIDFANIQKQNGNITAILSDMAETSINDGDLYQKIAVLLQQKNVKKLIAIGKIFANFSHFFEMEKSFFPSTDAFFSDFNFDSLHNETILLKAARAFEFEKINLLLQEKIHETVLEVDFAAMKNNLDYFRSKLKPQTKIMAMVKAYSYGSGSYEIANFLQFNNVDYLAVAYSDEGLELRNMGIKMPIMVVNPEKDSLEKLLKYDLEAEIYSFEVLNQLFDEIKKHRPEKAINIHLKFDTGMHRLGFEKDDLQQLLKEIKNHPIVRVKSVFSHLAAADDPNEDVFTLRQIAVFEEMVENIEKELGYSVIKHILNTAGTMRFSDKQLDMVRIGIGLYGIAYNNEEQFNLQNISTLKANVAQVKHIKKGDTVGYNRHYIADSDRCIATISIGYADGLHRALGNGNYSVKINGVNCPIIGNICMDMCMVGLDGCEHTVAHLNNAVIFDSADDIKEIARISGTIPYEVLTGISGRVKRVYFQE
ncbi:MAG: alanine racemase [Bacteroidales bacterium]|jgi:alanine racemase|nr:alanine racemase [Bacteroidales bacterium]